MAILIRRSAQAPLFEAELSRRDLNFRLIGGKRTADEAARDLFAYMQVVASDRNEIAFRHHQHPEPRHRRGDDRAPAWAR